MSVAPVVNQLRDALRERTRLENDFKTKILNRINAILEQLNNCDQESLPAPAAGVLNIAIRDLDAIVHEIRNPENMTDVAVEEIVKPLKIRQATNTMRLLENGRPVDDQRPLIPAPASSQTRSRNPFSLGSPSTWFSRPRAPGTVELGRVPDTAGSELDDDYVEFDDGLPGGPRYGLPRRVAPGTRTTGPGGKRTRRKYRNRT